MEISENTSLSQLIVALSDRQNSSLDADLELSKRVVQNEPPCVNYYLGDFSKDIVTYISNNLKRNILTDFYFFLAEPFNSNSIPLWKKVSEYKGLNNCSLHSYTSVISTRHFWKEFKKEKKQKEIETEWIDFIDYQSLLKYNTGVDEEEEREKDDNAFLITQKINNAFNQLSPRDQLIIKLTIKEKHNSLDVYEMVESFIHPEGKNGLDSNQVKANWTSKDKQTAVSLWKGRALEHLRKKCSSIKK